MRETKKLFIISSLWFVKGSLVTIILLIILMLNGLLVGCSNLSVDNKRGLQMDKQLLNNHIIPSAQQIEILLADLIPFIPETNTSMLLVRVDDVKLVHTIDEGIEVEVGIVTLEVLQVLYSKDLVQGVIIGVPFKRIFDPSIRVRNNINQWNNLALTKGELLMLAGRITGVSNVLKGMAAIHVDGLDNSVINAVKQCYMIEALNGRMDDNHSILIDALTDKEDILRFYVLGFLGRQGIDSRKVGVELIIKAVESGKMGPVDKLDLGAYLTRDYFFDSDLGDDLVNEKIVASLAKMLVQETDHDRVLDLAQLLGSCVLDEFSPKADVNRLVRSSLIAKIHTPTPNQVTSKLSDLLLKADEMERDGIKELLEAWQDAEAAAATH